MTILRLKKTINVATICAALGMLFIAAVMVMSLFWINPVKASDELNNLVSPNMADYMKVYGNGQKFTINDVE